MSTGTPHQESPANWRTDPDLRQVDVVVCTTAGTFVGHTYRTSRLRLLDAVNKGVAARGTRIALDYIPLTEVEIHLPDGQQSKMAAMHIRKANVIFVAERSGGQPEGDIGKAGKVVTAKKPLGARMYVSPYTLEGQLHSLSWAELVTSLHSGDTFFPVTNVTASPPLVTGEAQFEFMAVNKDRVIYISEAG